MIVTLFDGMFDNVGAEHETTPTDFINLLVDSTLTLTRAEKKSAFAFAGCRFTGTRSKATGYDASVIALDIDDNGVDIFDATWAVQDLGCPFALYTTTKHTRDHNRFRVVLPLDRTVQSDEFEDLWSGLQRRFAPAGVILDKNARDISRMSILPYRWSGECENIDFADADAFVIGQTTGIALDVDAILKHYPEPKREPYRKPATTSAFYDPAAAERFEYRQWVNAQTPRATLLNFEQSPIITTKALQKAETAAPGARVYALLCSVASVAALKGIPIDTPLLVEIAEIFSQRIGRKAERGENERDAARALAFGKRSAR